MSRIRIERACIERFIDGDMEAFREVYEQTENYVFAVAYRMVMSRAEAEDLTHDIYVLIYRKRRSFHYTAQFTTWLYRVATNHVINHLKRKSLLKSKLLERLFSFGREDGYDPSVHEDEKDIAQSLLNQVKPEFRLCVVLHDIQDMPYQQIADHLNISIGTVKSRLNRGRKAVIDAYKKEVSDNAGE